MNMHMKGELFMFPRRRPCGCMKPCQCHQPVKEIVYPTKEDVVHKCTEETVKHIHPSHTTIVNHHLVKNEHLYPHTTSVENTFDEVDVMGTMTGPGNFGPGMPTGPGAGPNANVMGAQSGWHQHDKGKKHHYKQKPNKWC